MSSFRHVYRWDLDKTYLDSPFESLSGMVRMSLQRPEEKVNVPGSAALLRELARDREALDPARICVVSGSPSQMRTVLEDKLRLDGIRWHEFHLKPQWENLKRGRFRAVREQVGYKLPLLLESHAATPGPPGESLFGDDAEADAFIYSFYAELCAGRVGDDVLVSVLKAAGAYGDAIDRCRAALSRFERRDVVETIFIHLDRRTPPAAFRDFGPRVVPVWNYFQAALVLFAKRHLDARGVVMVTRAFLEREGHTTLGLANLFQDVMRRGHLPASAMQDLALGIQDLQDVVREADVVWTCVQRFTDLGESRRFLPPAPPSGADWLALLETTRRKA